MAAEKQHADAPAVYAQPVGVTAHLQLTHSTAGFEVTGTAKSRERFLRTWFCWESFFPCSRYTQIRSNSSPGHQRVAVHRNIPQKPTQRVEKLQVHSNSRGSYLLGVSVSRCTEIILKNVLCRSKYPPGKLQFAGVVISWAWACNRTPKQSSKTYSAGRKTPRYCQNHEEVISWAWAYRDTPK